MDRADLKGKLLGALIKFAVLQQALCVFLQSAVNARRDQTALISCDALPPDPASFPTGQATGSCRAR